MNWTSWPSLQAIVWLFPVVFLIHDSEEILTVERWIKANRQVIRQRFAGRRFIDLILRRAEETTTARFSAIVACLFLAICIASYLATSGNYIWFVSGLAVLFVNVLTHIGQTLIFGGYTPGVVSAVVVAFPYSVYAFIRLFAAQTFTFPTIWFAVPIGVITVGLVFLVGNLLGRMIFRSPKNK